MLSYIKYILRSNPLYVKYCQARVNDLRYFIKNVRLYLKKYHFSIDKNFSGRNTLYFIFDPNQKHPGLADRLKVICCMYWVAKTNGFDFKIILDSSLNLSNYLGENKVKWIGAEKELSYSLKNSRLLAYNGGGKIPKLNKNIKQYHVFYYIGLNIMVHNVKNWQCVWRECFNELFVYKDVLLKKYLETGLTRKKYIAAHLRFVNALEHFEDGHYNSISKEQQTKLIDDCPKTLHEIQNNHKEPLVVFSDSNTFINICKRVGFKTLQGNIGHISFNSDTETELKAFLDFYAISQSKKVYRIIKPHMYGTTFSYYAAICGNAEFETIA